MLKDFEINATGNIDRRSLLSDMKEGDVRSRINFMVIGIGESLRNRKVPGAIRYTTSTLTGNYLSGFRYYTKNHVRETVAFINGRLYFISDAGAETSDVLVFLVDSDPCWLNMRVSNTDMLYFTCGDGAGLYSHDGAIHNSFKKETAFTLNPVDMVEFLDRAWYIEENSEITTFSKNLDPVNVTDSSDAGEIVVEAHGGSRIMKQAVFNSRLFFLKNDMICGLEGRTPSTFQIERIIDNLGCIARGSVQVTPIGIIFLGSDFEFHVFNGSTYKTLSYKAAIGGDKTKNLSPLINKQKTRRIVSTYYDNIYRCSFAGNGKATNDTEWCFDLTNEKDFMTWGFNISCYIPCAHEPDEPFLLTGRTDLGRLMKMYQGLNWDNGSSDPKMYFKLQTAAYKAPGARNVRFKDLYPTCEVLGKEKPKVYAVLDGRTRKSDWALGQWKISGEEVGVGTFNMQTQEEVTTRVVLPYGKAKGQSLSLVIEDESNNQDFGFSKVSGRAILKSASKLSEKVGA